MTEKRTIADCIIVAAGSGKRLGAKMPKAFVNLGDRPLFVHSLLVFARHRAIDKIILVVPAAMTDKARKIVSTLRVKKEIIIVKGGLHRWLSVKSGVDVSKAEWVMIHDSARPFLTKRIINAVLSVSGKYDAVIAATPEVDTIRELKNPAVPRDEESSIPMEKKHTHSRSLTPKQASRNALAMGFTGDCAGGTLDRNGLVRVQTPQMFRRAGLSAAFSRAALLPSPPTDEAMLMQAAGVCVGIAQGDPLNFKITTKQDFEMAEALLKRRKKVDG